MFPSRDDSRLVRFAWCCGSSARRQVARRIDRLALATHLEVQLHAVRVGAAHLGDLLARSEEHTSELQSHSDLVCRLLLEKKKKQLKHTEVQSWHLTCETSN